MKFVLEDTDLRIIPETPLDHFHLGKISAGYIFDIQEDAKEKSIAYISFHVSTILKALADGTLYQLIDVDY